MTATLPSFDLAAVVLGYLPSELFVRASQAAGIQNRTFSTDVASVVPLILRGLADQVSFRRTGARLTTVLAKMSDETIPLILTSLDAGHKGSVVAAGRDLLFEAIGEEAAIPLVSDVARQLRITKEMASNLVAILVPAAFSALADIQRYYAFGADELETVFEAQSDNIERAIAAHQEYAVGYRLARRGSLDKPQTETTRETSSRGIFQDAAAALTPATGISGALSNRISVAQRFSAATAPSAGVGIFGLIGSALILSVLLFSILSFSAARNNARFLAKQEQDQTDGSKVTVAPAAPAAPAATSLALPVVVAQRDISANRQTVSERYEFRDGRQLPSVMIEPMAQQSSASPQRLMPFVAAIPAQPVAVSAPPAIFVAPIATSALPEPVQPVQPTVALAVEADKIVPEPDKTAKVALEIELVPQPAPEAIERKLEPEPAQPAGPSVVAAAVAAAPEASATAAKVSSPQDTNGERRTADLKACRAAADTEEVKQALRFEVAKDGVDWASNTAIKKLLRAIKGCPSAKVRIEGHTDADGTAARNAALSTRRAKMLYDHFAASEISPDRMTYVGLGASKPAAPNTADDKVRNRRLEIHFE